MTRSELVARLEEIKRIWDEDDQKSITRLIEDIKDEGVLDIQIPPKVEDEK